MIGLIGIAAGAVAWRPWSRVAGGLSGGGLVYSTLGAVKSIDDTSLVIARFQGQSDMTLRLTPATSRQGRLAIGGLVAVRYRQDHGRQIATAIAAQGSRE